MLWSLLDVDIVTGNEIPVVSIGESLIYALVGFAITFLGVAILIFLIWLVGKIIGSVTGKRRSKQNAAQASLPADVPAEDDGLSEEIRVAIVAAISAYYMSESSNCEFKVKRIKRL